MENAKDTFYVTLRNRLKVLNPQRTMILRGVQRPGILVEESEAVQPQPRTDVFVLQWTDLKVDMQLPSVMTQMTCEIRYTTCGTQANAELDRGRALSQMDAELLTLLSPNSAQKMNYGQTPAAAMETFVFWSGPDFQPLTTLRDSLTRVAKVTVFAFQEQGEL